MTPRLLLLAALLVPTGAGAQDATGTVTISKPTLRADMTTAGMTAILKLSHDTKEVFSVAPDGTVLLRGQNVEQMSSDEAKVAMVLLAKWIVSQSNESSNMQYMSRQTDYLLERLERCEAAKKPEHRPTCKDYTLGVGWACIDTFYGPELTRVVFKDFNPCMTRCHGKWKNY